MHMFRARTDEFIQHVQGELNKRPRERFNFRSPLHIFERLAR